MCDIVVKKFTFAISSPDEFLYRMVKKIAENLNRLSGAHQCHRQTDRRNGDSI